MLRKLNFNTNQIKIILNIAILGTILYLGMLIYQTYTGNGFLYVHYFIFPSILFTVYLGIFYFYSSKFFYFAIFFMVILYFVFIPFYSPIDEGAHFDIILHIAQTKSFPILFDNINSSLLMQLTGNNVPGGLQYEATHPPFYYLIGALCILPFKNSILISFFILRILDVLILAVTFVIVMKVYTILVTKKKIIEQPIVLMLLFISFFINPAFITRMITISNESLVVVLFSVLFYLVIRFENTVLSYKQIIILAVLSVVLLLTKFTTIYVIGLIVIALILSKQIKKIPLYIFTTGLLSSPWFIYNYLHYDSLTGNAIHAEYVRKLVNPENMIMHSQYIVQKLSYFLGSFWNPQESTYPNLQEPFNFITTTLSSVLLYSILFNIFYVIYTYIKYKKIEKILILSLVSIILNIAVVIYGTWSESIDILIGRYLYMNIVPLTIIIYFSLKKLIQIKYRSYIAITIFILTMFLTVNQLFTFMQAPYNLLERAKTYILITHINSENYNTDAYKQYVTKQNLSIIPMSFSIDKSKTTVTRNITIDKPSKLNDISFLNNYYNVIGLDPYILWKLPYIFKTTSKDVLSLDLKYAQGVNLKNKTAQLFWDDGSGFSEEKSITFDISKSQSYTIPIGKNQQWLDSKVVKALRFDMVTTDTKVSFQVDNLQLLKLQ
ncbi:hypothetical protein PO903_02440 [Paenibacillus sp. PK4536]|uniref:hypothetical protein n=1 Tax=Paenibacillus sp. PK4536 TaxID=3024576 RepID=UPI00235896EB|nr:hypothetical protein [Paenibacillus sp. PK4536]WIM39762.1 hypothetical protein PO903_02440 [Paenibacillus sp. PK4536]